MRKTTWAWVSPLALLAALALAGCGGGGGGGGGGGNNNGGGNTPNPFTLTATPGHGYDVLSWSLPGAPVGTTYTVQRATSSGGPYTDLPIPAGGSTYITTTTATSYHDASYPNNTSNGATNVPGPSASTQYFYKVVSNFNSATTDATASTPLGPTIAQSTSIPPADPNNASKAAAPFNLSDSGTQFTYTVSQANPNNAKVTMAIVLDYAASVSDLRNITVNITGTDQIISEATLAANGTTPGTGGISINASNPREIDIDTSKAGLNLPVAPSYSLVSLNAYVATAHGGTTYVPVGIGTQIQGVGVDETGTLPVSSEPYAGQFVFDIKNQTNGT